ncbi:hypothetical protein NQ315_008091 [Exocentrus adspersus]|uniref:Reverse transcriptase domain-containing protein n=1 Tax=Exocentrus adspersus TaxID=1586481 RepID=A0AAV8VWT6_9CUCU|nr:hypothetical protein NQ315_008091 [Exocentrus adspersus]
MDVEQSRINKTGGVEEKSTYTTKSITSSNAKIDIYYEKHKCLTFTDDLVVLTESREESKEVVKKLEEQLVKSGLRINEKETKYQTNGGKTYKFEESVIQMTGFRSLGDDEEVEFECQVSEKGLEATKVTGPQSSDCRGSHRRPLSKKTCYNCGEFANHIAAKCQLGPQPKRCHNCKSEEHLIADCPQRTDRTQPKKSGGSDRSGNGSASTSTSQIGPSTLSEGISKLQIELGLRQLPIKVVITSFISLNPEHSTESVMTAPYRISIPQDLFSVLKQKRDNPFHYVLLFLDLDSSDSQRNDNNYQPSEADSRHIYNRSLTTKKLTASQFPIQFPTW